MILSKIRSFFKKENKQFYSKSILDINGKEFKFSLLKGKKVLLVNTASECGLTPQYTLLENLFQKYKNHDFIVIGFPSNDFGNQEPLSNENIFTFCESNYSISFPIMQKSNVLGPYKNKVYQWLENHDQKYIPTWNFHKFLVDENGYLIKEFEPGTNPLDKSLIDLL